MSGFQNIRGKSPYDSNLTLFHLAAILGKPEFVEPFILSQMQNAVTLSHRTVLHEAVSHGQIAVVRELMRFAPQEMAQMKHSVDRDEQSPISCAARTDQFQMLLELGEDVRSVLRKELPAPSPSPMSSSFSFLSLPTDLRLLILKKLKLQDQLAFRQASHKTQEDFARLKVIDPVSFKVSSQNPAELERLSSAVKRIFPHGGVRIQIYNPSPLFLETFRNAELDIHLVNSILSPPPGASIKVRSLKLGGDSPSAVAFLRAALEGNTLETVSFARAYNAKVVINSEILDVLAELLPKNSSLRTLKIIGSLPLNDQKLLPRLTEIVKSSPSVDTLVLEQNLISEAAYSTTLKGLLPLISFEKIKNLDLGVSFQEGFFLDTIDPFFGALKSRRNIESLALQGLIYSPKIVDVLRANLALKTLTMYGGPVHPLNHPDVLQAVLEHPSIEALDLDGPSEHHKSNVDAQSVIQILKKNKKIQSLRTAFVLDSEQSKLALAEAFDSNRTLREIELHEPEFLEFVPLRSSLIKNPQITWIGFGEVAKSKQASVHEQLKWISELKTPSRSIHIGAITLEAKDLTSNETLGIIHGIDSIAEIKLWSLTWKQVQSLKSLAGLRNLGSLKLYLVEKSYEDSLRTRWYPEFHRLNPNIKVQLNDIDLQIP